eukprot:Skav205575  [mRNA]  locus=scaffold460:30926:34586:+ [translate_table: standard]
MFSLVLSLLLQWAVSEVKIPTVEIAKGVHMPVMSIGWQSTWMVLIIASKVEEVDPTCYRIISSNASEIVASWIQQGGRGIDTALVYRDQSVVPEDHRQTETLHFTTHGLEMFVHMDHLSSFRQELAKAGIDRKDVFITTKRLTCTAVEDYIDLLLIHFPSGDCKEAWLLGNSRAWSILEEYHSKGTLRAIGVSNFKKSNLDGGKGFKGLQEVNQIELNVLEYDQEAMDTSKQLNITVEAYSPVGRSGHSGDIRDNKIIKSIAAAHNVSTYQVALKWILQHGNIITFQSSSAQHQAEDADVFNFQLTEDDMKDTQLMKFDVSQFSRARSSACRMPQARRYQSTSDLQEICTT